MTEPSDKTKQALMAAYTAKDSLIAAKTEDEGAALALATAQTAKAQTGSALTQAGNDLHNATIALYQALAEDLNQPPPE